MSSRSPDEFRLGVRPYDRGPGTGDEPEDPHELLHRARQLTAHGHPWAGSAWERAATALQRAGGALTPGDHADALDATALDCRGAARPAAGPLFFRAADLHEQAGQRGKALVSRARALVAGSGSGHGPGATAFARLTELCERATALHAVGQTGTAETATVLLLRGRARADLLDTAPDPTAEAGALREELTRLIAFAVPHRADPAVLGVLADTRALLGRIMAPDDPAAALAHLRAAVDDHGAGGGPWPVTEHQLMLATVLRTTGAPEEAAALLRAALASEAPDAPLRGADRARLCLALARTVAGAHERGRTAPGADEEDEPLSLLAEAVRHADGPAQDVRVGALARLLLGAAYAERGRCREASDLFEQALAGFTEDGDAAARVRARVGLADCVVRRGEPGRAAREYALAEAEARCWDDRRHGADLSHRTARALGMAGSPEKAARAYERAADLWRAAGDHASAARSLRARARQVRAVWGDAAAEVVLAEALREAGRGPGDADGAVDNHRRLSDAPERTHRPPREVRAAGGTVDAEAAAEDGAEVDVEADPEIESGTDDDSCRGGPWPGSRELPEPFGPPGHYQVNVYGEVGGAGPRAATAPGTRVQGCV
ncbi:hypothetical protein [Streptomyces sp. NBC_00572]|uniref:hypothetical protein n=1 Tax=Streptomyces sp. NBC_00572 TaxID=2903664 RepID=UPI0022553B3C|nr:hypothetical protein [Streptomyces sp. NBC_00572]MCX4986760.1 hypothetical protein [Streptomyces sp. NBC_00572]